MSRQRPVVLVYHGVGFASDSDDPRRLVTSPEHLIDHVHLLLGRGYRFLQAGELPQDGPAEGTATLTFDDGWRNGLTVALPVLRSLGVRATFFVCPGLFGQQHPDVPGEVGELIRAEEARALHDAGMELGSHTLTHPDLRALDDAELERELVESKQALEELTGEPCRALAYPYGLYDERVVRAAGAAGYELAFGWLPGPWRTLEAPRLPAPPRHGAHRLALKLLGIRRPGR
jgi:peptidoglycan/xylan/chitin deacetylase (PgdA/CDA1 family)